MTDQDSTSTTSENPPGTEPVSAIALLHSLRANSVRDTGNISLGSETPLFRVVLGSLLQGQIVELTQVSGLAHGVAFEDRLDLTLRRERDDGLTDDYGTVTITTSDLGFGPRTLQFLGSPGTSGLEYELTYEVVADSGKSVAAQV